jgi:hypothetical protein
MNVTLTPKEASERFWSAGLKINPKEVVDLAVQETCWVIKLA